MAVHLEVSPFLLIQMRNIYTLLRLASRIRNRRVRMFGLFLMHLARRRYVGIFIDPVLGCNFRCRMCYFSDENKRKEMHGHFGQSELDRIARALFHRALKLQIGCGAEPTLSKDLIHLIRLGKQHGVPFITLTTNGHLLTPDLLHQALDAGLDELTLSMHGTTQATYESLMVNGRFSRFCELLQSVGEIAPHYPHFRLRINYTMNEDNVAELASLPSLMEGIPLHVLQLRPIQQIGASSYTNFSLTKIREEYDRVIAPLVELCRDRGITVLTPEKENLAVLAEDEVAGNDTAFEKATYVYVSPQQCWRKDFDFRSESFESYAARTRLSWQLLRQVFVSSPPPSKSVTTKMNYSVKK